jgi:hypothetical protein
MRMMEQPADGHDPAPTSDCGFVQYGQAAAYLAERNLDQEGLGCTYYSELEDQWWAVLEYVGKREFGRLSIRRRVESLDGGSETFVPWQETGAESDRWASSMWISTSVLEDILKNPPPADICKGMQVVEQERRRRDRERASRRAQGLFALWEAAHEAAPAMRMQEYEVLDAIQKAASRGELPAYMHGASLPIHVAVGVHAHPKHECTAEDLDNWMRVNRIRCDFSFVARARELASAAAAVKGASTPPDRNRVARDATRWEQADAAGKRALAEEAVRRFGSKAAAARAFGISRTRLQVVLHGTRGLKPSPARGAAAAPVSLEQAWNRRGS